MGNRKKNYVLLTLILLVSLYQNCAQNTFSTDLKTSENPSNLNGTIASSTSTTNSNNGNSTSTNNNSLCDPQTVGAPTLIYNPLKIDPAYSGFGALGGRAISGKATLTFSGINVGANCSKAVSVQCSITGLKDSNNQATVSYFDVTGTATGLLNNQNFLSCQSSPNTLNDSGSFTVNLNINDNDSQKRCFSGNPQLEVSLRSAADTTKISQKIKIPIGIFNNCWIETKEVPAKDRFDFLGSAVSLSNDWLAALAPGDDGVNNETSNIGAVYIYKKDPISQAWNLKQTVRTKDNTNNSGELGDNPSSIAIFGEYMAVGSYANRNNLGAVYLFKNTSQQWALVTKIPGLVAGGMFGYSIALNSQFLFVGAPQENGMSGSVYVYSLSNLSLKQKIQLNSNLANYFGTALSVNNNTLAAGGMGYLLHLDEYTGFANIYNYNPTTDQWTERSNNPLSFSSAKDKISGKDASGKSITINIPKASQLGFSVSVGTDFVATGAPGLNRDGSNTMGSVFVLSLSNNEVRVLTDPANETNVAYGGALNFSGNNLYIGSKMSKSLQGAVDSWSLTSTATKFNRRILSLTGVASDAFGFSLAVSSTDLIVGSRLNDEPLSDSGSLHFFKVGLP